MEKTIFSKIIDREIPSTILYEDENYIVIKDINPQAPVHLLIITKKTIESFHTTSNSEDKELIKWMFNIAWKIIDQEWLTWCQLHINSWKDHNQLVPHMHLHLLSRWTISEMMN